MSEDTELMQLLENMDAAKDRCNSAGAVFEQAERDAIDARDKVGEFCARKYYGIERGDTVTYTERQRQGKQVTYRIVAERFQFNANYPDEVCISGRMTTKSGAEGRYNHVELDKKCYVTFVSTQHPAERGEGERG